jgi:signal transduction histidine kinase
MHHIGVGLISYRSNGSVGLINNAAKRLLRVQYLNNIATLSEFSPQLVETLSRISSGEKRIVKVVDGDELLELVIYGTQFKMRGTPYTLVSIQDIQTELEEKEIEAWQKLARVLTHEIMNSITPISSLATSVRELLDDGLPSHASDVREAVQTIERRSQSLLGFVQAYRSLTRIPRPDLSIFPVRRLLEDVELLFRNELTQYGIALETSIDPSGLDLTADKSLIEQILINLVRNAIQALQGTERGRIHIRAFLGERGRPMLQVTDNGPGIEPEALEKVFIPFFSTKSDGSGIGLSLSRQIMRAHGGTMGIKSSPGEETTVTLRF